MPSLTIRHVTTYRYRQPVAFGEHRMMLLPRDSHEQRVVTASLGISPQPIGLRFVQDAFGNHVGIANFSGRAKELRFESCVCVEHSPANSAGVEIGKAGAGLPFEYGADEMPDLAHCIERHQPDPGNEVGRWAHQFLPSRGPIGAFEFLKRLSRGISQGFLYRRRDSKGVQTPVETLRLGHGSCRDFAVLMIDAARALGFAARFVSGYVVIPPEDPEDFTGGSAGGSTHAWAQIYLPDIGWLDFDPTSGSVGNTDLISVAVVRDPIHATPLYGTFFGCPADSLGMEVAVSVTRGTLNAMGTTRRHFPDSSWSQFPRATLAPERGRSMESAEIG